MHESIRTWIPTSPGPEVEGWLGAWRPALPPPATVLWLAPSLALLLLGTGYACGLLKARGRARTGVTRKIQHFVVFGAATLLQVTLGQEAVNVLGAVGSAYIALMLVLGEGSPVYEAFAREEDRPHRSAYVVIPLVATALGGILSTALFGAFAAVGFAVTGLGDAVAEPVGILHGRRFYRVPGLGLGVQSRRSVEGSAAVLVASLGAAALVLAWIPGGPGFGARALLAALLVSAAATVTEALSPHGIDNFTLQLSASLVAWAAAA